MYVTEEEEENDDEDRCCNIGGTGDMLCSEGGRLRGCGLLGLLIDGEAGALVAVVVVGCVDLVGKATDVCFEAVAPVDVRRNEKLDRFCERSVSIAAPATVGLHVRLGVGSAALGCCGCLLLLGVVMDDDVDDDDAELGDTATFLIFSLALSLLMTLRLTGRRSKCSSCGEKIISSSSSS